MLQPFKGVKQYAATVKGVKNMLQLHAFKGVKKL